MYLQSVNEQPRQIRNLRTAKRMSKSDNNQHDGHSNSFAVGASSLSSHLLPPPPPPPPPPPVSLPKQKACGFFNSLKHRWSHGWTKERGRGSFVRDRERRGSQSTDYAADNSSAEHSSSGTPLTQSPRHKVKMPEDQPLLEIDGDCTLNMRSYSRGISQPFTNFDGINELQLSEAQQRRDATLRKHAFFQIRIHLVSGHDLIAMDKNGTSDPYVKFKIGGRLLHKSKTVYRDLNPVWNETFVTAIEDPFQPINIKVFDYDWGLQDDFMGLVKLNLTTLELGQPTDINIKLTDPSLPKRSLGELRLNVTLWPRSQEDKEQYFQRHQRLADTSKRLKSQIWNSVVTIILVEAKGLISGIDTDIVEPYVKFRLGNEKFRSKTAWRARWLEQFDLHLFEDDQILEVAVWSKNMQCGKCNIDLRNLPREHTLRLWQQLDDNAGQVLLMLTISGTTASETISDLTSHKDDPREKQTLQSRYLLGKTHQNLRDVGHLTVKVFGALGLAAADLGGKSDPFCVLELINARLQTQTEYKTLTPNWNKIFTFNVKDMTSVLEVTVYDEDRDHKVEFLGRLAIPLLRIRNGEKRWYTLKDKKMFSRAKGNFPQILLEMNVVWNPLRAAIRSLEPKEEKLVLQEVRFKRQLFLRNVLRFKAVIVQFLDWGRIIQSSFEWESPARSFVALILWIFGCIWFDVSTIPAVVLLLLLKNWFIRWLTGNSAPSTSYEYDLGGSDDEEDDDKEKEEKKTIKERLQAIQDVSQTVQNTIGYLASIGESIKNTFNFSVPELSWLAVIILFGVFLILHFIPLRVLLLVWGLFKFSRRLFRPHTVPNNEILDFLSRVPDDEEMIMYRELATHSTPDMARRDPRKKFKTT